MLSLLWYVFIFPSVIAIDCGNETVHNATFGIYFPNDSLDFMDHPKIGGSFLRVKEIDVVYPVPNPWENIEKISFISVEDRLGGGHGACCYITAGGVGYNHTILHLVSQRSHGIDSIIRIYTRKQDYLN